MLGDREFTSEQVAALCGVTRVTVADWIARGRLAVRWTAGGHRRIPRASLAAFMEQHGYAVPRIVASARVLVHVLDDDAPFRSRIAAQLEVTGAFDVRTFEPGVESILAIGTEAPDVVIASLAAAGFDARNLVSAIRGERALIDTVVVAFTQFDEEVAGARRNGADLAMSKSRADELLPMLVRVLRERQRRVDANGSAGT